MGRRLEYAGVEGPPSCRLFRHSEVAGQLHGMQTQVEERALRERHGLPLAGKVQTAVVAACQASDLDKAPLVRADGAVAEPETAAIPMLVANLLKRQARYDDAQARLQSAPPKISGDREMRRLRTHLRLIRAAAGSDAEERLAAPLRRTGRSGEPLRARCPAVAGRRLRGCAAGTLGPLNARVWLALRRRGAGAESRRRGARRR
jgi:thioredoxin-like negative regulator of GroEL